MIDKILKHKYINGVSEGEKVILMKDFPRLIFLCSDFASAGKIKRGFESLGKHVEIVTASRETQSPSDANLLPFVSAINRYLSGKLDVIVFLPNSFLVKFDLNIYKNLPFITKGQDYDLVNLCNLIVQLGYQKCDLVSKEGEFALRGDILDIFVVGQENATRIEFFGDEIDEIHSFDISSMKNLKTLDSVLIGPCNLFCGVNSAFDLEGVKVVNEPKRIEDEIKLLIKSYSVMTEFNQNNYNDFDSLLPRANYVFNSHKLESDAYQNSSMPTRVYLTDFMALKNDILQAQKMDMSVILYSGDKAQKIKDFLTENGMIYHDYEAEKFDCGKIYVSNSPFPFNYSFINEKILAIGYESLFKTSISAFSRGKHSVFYLPKLGDYVVHTFHGIGRCIKIERMKLADYEKDYFVIEYKNGGVLYLPSEQANTISAYVGSEEEPKLSSLGGAEFSRLKARVKAGLKEMAFNLANVYAERKNSKGFAFSRDEFLDAKFADEFKYTETPDQLKAIAEIEKDMESSKIMDRLVCGDVGFGKTEVALRACFKCIYNGKQCALLCPTTILSQQHFLTAKSRLEKFGARVEVLNRFKTSAQVKQILSDLKDGKIDMLIGTHRLLSQDVVFKDLGLLVLDEEQRFGVEDKEKIKNAKRSVDVLSLSATPIPRTLNMSLSGIRDISLITTPPKDRLPIQTYVAEQSDEIIKDVLSREISRGGIAFVIYNRVETIEEFARYVKKLVPKAQIGIAHGQMSERELERVIYNLYEGKFNVLVSTTLIENGIDLPSANSMIIIDADRLGLGQLYQIRGRIGRSDRLSYAYLLYDKDKILGVDAYKRLSAIKEFSELGSGFKIAMRDLEIRGAGNIFGKEQHGHIAKVGYDMFVKLLDEAVKELQGQKTTEKHAVKLEIPLDAFISEEYIPSSDERILMYTKISNIKNEADEQEILKTLADGFGQVPDAVKNLCKIARLKNLASNFDIVKISVNAAASVIILNKSEEILPPSLAVNLKDYNGVLSYDNLPKITFKNGGSVIKNVNILIEFFNASLTKNENIGKNA